MSATASAPARLRAVLAEPSAAVAAGCYDGVSARLVEQAGFRVAHMSGFAVAASVLGQPDVGLLTMSEMAGAAQRLARVLTIPLLADADTGYGNALNVARTVDTYARAGVAGLHLEDQVAPKRCGHLTGKDVIATDEMAAKLVVAVDARDSATQTADDAMVIVARTDANAVEGFDAALERARRYRDAGVDALFVEALDTPAQVEAVAAAFPNTPLVFNQPEARVAEFTFAELGEMGYRLVLAPITSLLSGARAMQTALADLADAPTGGANPAHMSYDELLALVDYPAIEAAEQRYR